MIRLRQRGTVFLVRLACVLGLLALAQMVLSILFPAPLVVILAMSSGQATGVLACLCYLAAILSEILRHEANDPSKGPVPPKRG